MIQITFARSHGPRQPSLIVNVIEVDNRLCRHSLLSHSTGTDGFRFSVTPQQQPLQTIICTKTRRLDANLGDDSILSTLIPFSCILFKSPLGVDDDIPLLSECVMSINCFQAVKAGIQRVHATLQPSRVQEYVSSSTRQCTVDDSQVHIQK